MLAEYTASAWQTDTTEISTNIHQVFKPDLDMVNLDTV